MIGQLLEHHLVMPDGYSVNQLFTSDLWALLRPRARNSQAGLWLQLIVVRTHPLDRGKKRIRGVLWQLQISLET